MTAYDIIKRPIITEQSMADAEMKRYTFEVAKTANKIEIAKAVEELQRPQTRSRRCPRRAEALWLHRAP